MPSSSIITLDTNQSLPILEGVGQYYPNIAPWLKGLKKGTETPILTTIRNNQIIGICIGKDTPLEKKIRCVRIHPDYKHTGIGVKLIDSMMDILETDKPYCTVPQEMFHDFSRLFINRYNYKLDLVEKGLYREKTLEYIFNIENSNDY